MIPQTITVTFDEVVQEKLDAIANCLAGIAQTQAQQAISWSLPITAVTESLPPITAITDGAISGLGFRSKTDLLGKLEDIREAIDEGRRSDALVLINGWIGAIKAAEADSGW